MKSFNAIIFLAIGMASAQNATSTITISNGCPSAAADVMVTRSGVVVPSCAAGNGTKPTISSVSGGMMPGATGSAPPSQFTGAAGKNAPLMAIGGLGLAAFLL